MPIIRISRSDNRIIGRVRSAVDNECIEVSEELFGRIISNPSAFRFYPETNQIDLVEDYSVAKNSLGLDAVALFISTVNQNIYVPELNVDVSISGELGNHLLLAIALAKYEPQTIICSTNGVVSTLRVDEKAAKLIAKAYAEKSSSLLTSLGVSNESTD